MPTVRDTPQKLGTQTLTNSPDIDIDIVWSRAPKMEEAGVVGRIKPTQDFLCGTKRYFNMSNVPNSRQVRNVTSDPDHVPYPNLAQ